MATTRPSSINGFINARSAFLGLCRVAFFGLRHATAAPLSALGHGGAGDEPEAEGPGLLAMYILSAVLVLLGGAFAGLTIAFMGQDGIYLKVLKDDIHESRSQRKSAEKVLNLLNRGKHWILVTLLLANVIVNESLPVVLDRCLGGGIAAIIGSTVLIVIFGEVVPQSICVRYGLSIGGSMAPVVLLMMWLTAPISWPIAKLLDRILGIHEGAVYKKSGLKTLVTLHQTMGEVSERLNTDEVTIIRAVLDLKAKSVRSVMTPMEDVFTLSADAVLDEKLMGRILNAGYSRIPVHSPENRTDFVGMLLVKILITYDPEDCMQVKDFALAALPETRPETSCLDILNYFQDGKSHMALVTSAPGQDHGALGVVTLEDVIEELIGEEIVDESDVYIDVHKAIRRLAPAPTSTFLRRNSQQQQSHDDAAGASPSAARPAERSDERSASVSYEALDASPRTVTFMLKRSSTGPDGISSSSGIPVKASMDAMRQHLRHLGPSNPASNPKNVQSTNVTVKPGTGLTPVPSPFRRAEPMREPSELGQQPAILERHGSDEETPLLGARGPAVDKAKGSLRPEKLNYGSGEAHGQRAASGSSTAKPSLSVATDGSSTVIPGSDYGRASSKASEHTTSPTASTGADNGGPYLHRTGTITESYVESGGVRKIIISSSGEEDDGNGNGTGAAHAGGSPETVTGPTGGTASTTEVMSASGDSDGESHEAQGLLDEAVSPTTYAEAAASGSGGGGGGSSSGGPSIGRKPKKSRKKGGRKR